MSIWIKKRLKEPTTYIGLGLLGQAVMTLTKSDPDHVRLIGDMAEQGAQQLAQGDYKAVLVTGLAGVLGILLGEKAR